MAALFLSSSPTSGGDIAFGPDEDSACANNGVDSVSEFGLQEKAPGPSGCFLLRRITYEGLDRLRCSSEGENFRRSDSNIGGDAPIFVNEHGRWRARGAE